MTGKVIGVDVVEASYCPFRRAHCGNPRLPTLTLNDFILQLESYRFTGVWLHLR